MVFGVLSLRAEVFANADSLLFAAKHNNLFYPYPIKVNFGSSNYLFALNIDTVSLLGYSHLVRDISVYHLQNYGN